MSAPKARLTAIAPHLLVSDIEVAAAYYRDRLGFRLDNVGYCVG